ncbi:MAG: nucleoside 2-deoxyribosyltransferase [Candidatus Pacebacteria bacterium]|nr:nucleoside 2-deoxyribosyltransferase [Candidatus Paceibacterota bacterium]
MNIYFTGSIYFRKDHKDFFERIVKRAEDLGHTIKADHILDVSMDDIRNKTLDTSTKYYKKVVKWIGKCDLVIAEMSFPSTINIGHEVTMALEQNKTILAFHEIGYESVFLKGMDDENFIYLEYDGSNLEDVVEEGLEYAKGRQLKRFNLMLEPELINYLNKLSKKNRKPKSSHIRELIRMDMKKQNN